MTKFLRRISNRYSKLGKRRKKKKVWRRPTGRDNKMREKRKGYPAVVSIGYKKGRREEITIVRNVKDLENIKEKAIIIIGNVGKKKKIEIAKKAKEMKIKIQNLNIEKFLKNIEKKAKKKVEETKSSTQSEKKSKKKETKKEEKK